MRPISISFSGRISYNVITGTGVPKIVQVTDIPRTKSGEIMELAVRDVVERQEVKNIGALDNPDALELFREFPELRS